MLHETKHQQQEEQKNFLLNKCDEGTFSFILFNHRTIFLSLSQCPCLPLGCLIKHLLELFATLIDTRDEWVLSTHPALLVDAGNLVTTRYQNDI